MVGPEQIGVLFHLTWLWRDDPGWSQLLSREDKDRLKFLDGILFYRNRSSRAMLQVYAICPIIPMLKGIGGSMSQDGTSIAAPYDRLEVAGVKRIYRSLRL